MTVTLDAPPRDASQGGRGRGRSERFRWRPRQVATLVARSGKEWVEDKAPKQAAALSYYVVFALGPILLIAVSIAGLVVGADAARQAVSGQIGKMVGPQGREAVVELMEGGLRGRAGVAGLAVGVTLLLVGAAGVFAQLRDSLNHIWEVEVRRQKGWQAKLKAFVRRNVLGFAGVAAVGFLLLVSLVVSAGLAAVGRHAEGWLPGGTVLWQGVNFVVAWVLVSGLFAFLFHFLPDARVAWRDTAAGAFVTGLLFVVGELLIGLYLGQSATTTKYGAAGSVLVLFVWVYYSGLILLFGAELTQVYANLFGSKVHPAKTAQPVHEHVAKHQDLPQREGAEDKGASRGTSRRGRAPAGASTDTTGQPARPAPPRKGQAPSTAASSRPAPSMPSRPSRPAPSLSSQSRRTV